MTPSQTEPTPKASLDVNTKWCKGCSLCVAVCPKGILSLDGLGKVYVDKPEECIGCGLCEETCPDYAIRVIKNV
ncbi:MAG: 4Fe-4S dicluster domain-containing protein [Actinobacteria bacterium]|nr:4Fe-4S dicluster domain-containing protein [Actinomycetota bacterium]